MARFWYNRILKLAIIAVFALGGLLLGTLTVVSQTNPEINYQGKLTDSSGLAVADGTYNMRFWLLQSTGQATTSAVWTETLTGTDRVQVTNGLFSVMLGSTSPLTSVDFNQTLYLGVEIGGTGGTPSWDGEMSPRKILGSVPAAFEARRLGGVASSSFLRSDIENSASALLTFLGGASTTQLTAGTTTVTRLSIGGETFTTISGNGLEEVNGSLNVANVATSSLDIAGTYTGGYVLVASTTASGGYAWVATSTLSVDNADTLDSLDSNQFLRADVNNATGSITDLTFANATGTTFSLGGDSFNDLTGTGLSVTDGALTANIGTSSVSAGGTYTNDYVLVASSTATGGWAWVATSTLGLGGGGSSLFTDDGALTYLTQTSDLFAVGTSSAKNSSLATFASSTANSLVSLAQYGAGDILNIFDGATEVFTIEDGGNVGIGVSDPAVKLDIAGGDIALDSTQDLRFNGDGDLNWRIGRNLISASGGSLSSDTLQLVVFNSGAAEQNGLQIVNQDNEALFEVDGFGGITVPTGSVGIGTTSPTRLLSVAGDAVITGALYDNSSSAGVNGYVLQSTGSGFQWVATSSLNYGESLFTDGGATTYLTSLTDQLAIGTSTGRATLTVDGDFYVGTTSTPALFVSSTTGRVGIGTSTPNATFEIAASSTPHLRLSHTAGSIFSEWQVTSAGNTRGYTTGDYFVFDSPKLDPVRFDFTSNNSPKLYFSAGSGTILAKTTLRLRSEHGSEGVQIQGTDESIVVHVNDTGLGFFGVTPVARPSATADLKDALVDLGLYTDGGSTPLNLDNGTLTVGDGYFSGSVGIGTTSPATGLHLYDLGTAVAPPTSGTDPNAAFRIDQGGSAIVMDMGIISGAGGYIQSVVSSNLGSNQDLLLNPNGGNVGIGTTTPSALLTVGSSTSGALQSGELYNSLYVSGALEVDGALYDTANNSAGTDGMVLQTTGTGFEWVATSSLGISGGNADTLDSLDSTAFLRADINNATGSITNLTFTNATGTTFSIAGDSFNDLTGTGLSVSGGALVADLGTSIDESELNITGSPTDGYVLQASSTSAGGFVWVATSTLGIASGATDFLSLTDTISSYNTDRILFTSSSAVVDSANFQFDDTSDTLTVGGLTLSDTLTTHTGRSTTTILNNDAWAWTIATSTNGRPLLRVNTTIGAEEVVIGGGAGDILIGDVGESVNLVFEESSTIHGQGENTITFGIAGDTFAVATGTRFGIGTSSPTRPFTIATSTYLAAALYDSTNSAGTDGYVLQTTGTGTVWVATSSLGFGGGGASALSDLSDADVSGAASGSIMVADNTGTFYDRATSTLNIDAVTVDGLDSTQFLRSDIGNATGSVTDLTFSHATGTTFSIAGDSFNDLTGTGLSVTNGALTTTLGTSIDESELNITGSPTDGYVLQASSTAAGGFVWAATSTLGINSSLFTDGGATTYLTSLTDQLAIGTSTGRATLTVDGDFYVGTTSTPALFVSSTTGNVGIGTTSPNTLLHLIGSVAPTLKIENSDTTIGNGETIGMVSFYANDASVVGQGTKAAIEALSDAAAGNEIGLRFLTSNSISLSERMRITSAGNVGIGTSADINARLTIQSEGTSDILNLLETGGTEVFTVLENGNVGIGTTTPGFQLDVITQNGAAVSIGSNDTVISSGDVLGTLNFKGLDPVLSGNSYVGAQISAEAVQNMTGNDAPSRLLFKGINDETAQLSEWMRLENGNLFIGTTTAGLVPNSSSRLSIQATGTTDILNLFETDGTEVFTVLENGNVGVGTSSPDAKLHLSVPTGQVEKMLSVTGYDNDGDYNVVEFVSEANQSVDFALHSSGNVGIGTSTDINARLTIQSEGTSDILNLFETDGQEVFTVLESGNVGVGTSSPMGRLSVSGVNVSNMLSLSGLDNDSLSYLVESFDENTGNRNFWLRSPGDNSADIDAYISGDVGIGTTSPWKTLSVAGDISATGALYDSVNNSAGTDGMVLQTTGTGFEWVATSSLGLGGSGGDADTLDSLDSTQFLRSDINNATGSVTDLTFTNATGTTFSIAGDSFNDLTGSGLSVSGGALVADLGTSIDESELNITGSPTDGYVLQASSTSAGGFVWVATSSLNFAESLFTDAGSFTYLTATGDDLYVGTSTQTTGNARLTIQSEGTNDILNLFETDGQEVFTVLENGNVGVGTVSPDYQFQLVSGANDYSTKIFNIQNSDNDDIIKVTADGRTFIGADNGINAVLGVNQSGAKTDGNLVVLSDASNALTMNTSGFSTDASDFNFGANGYGSAIDLDAPANNGMLRISGANTTIGMQSLGNTPDKTLRVYNASTTAGVTSFRVQEGSTQSTSEVFGVYANDDSTPRLVVQNGNVGIGTTTPSALLTVGSSTSGALQSGELYNSLYVSGALEVDGALYDSVNDSAGTDGMVLQTTGTGFEWVATSSLGLGGGDGGNADTLDSLDSSQFLRSDINNATGSVTDLTFSHATGTTFSIAGDSFNDLTGTGLSVSGGALTATLGTSIDESELNISGSPTDGYVLQASSTSAGGFVWVATSTLGLGGGSSLFTDAGTLTYLTQTGDNFAVGTSSALSSSLVTFSTSTSNTLLSLAQYGTGDLLNIFDGGSEVFTILDGGNVGIGSTTPEGRLAIHNDSVDGAQVAGIREYFTITNSTLNDVIYGDNTYINMPSAGGPTATTTMVGSVIRVADNTTLGNTVRALEVQANQGDNILGENTAISGFARTFGVRGVTEGDAGDTFEPAGGYFETRGATQGNAIRGFSSSITTADLFSLIQETSSFSGNAMDVDVASGFSGNYLLFKENGTNVFAIGSSGEIIASSTATSTFKNGIDLEGGCFAIDGTCIGGAAATDLDGLSDVDTTGHASGSLLVSDGTNWYARATSTLGLGGGDGGNADTLDSLDSTAFLRADINNATGSITDLTFTNATGTTFSIAGDSFNDLTGTGLSVSGGALVADLGTSIDESELNISGSPTDGYVLQASSTSAGGFVWVATSTLGFTAGDTVITVAASDTDSDLKASADYVADGTADDVQIQAAIDALPADGGTVHLLAGNYSISASINPATSTRLIGDGVGTVLTLANSSNVDVIRVIGATHYVHLAHFKIDGNKANQSSSDADGIEFFNGSTSTVSYVTVVDTDGSGIHMNGNDVGSETSHITVESVVISGADQYGIDDHFAFASKVHNSRVSGSAVGGMRGQSTQGQYLDNHIVNNTGPGIDAGDADDRVITGNTIEGNTTYGIYADVQGGWIINGNLINNNGSDAIHLTGFGVDAVISGNHIESNGGSGVFIDNFFSATIDGNVFRSNTDHGVYMDNSSTDNAVTSNIFSSNGGSPTSTIYIAGDDNVITGNSIAHSGTGYAIELPSGADQNVIGDNNFSGDAVGTSAISDAGNNRYTQHDRITVNTDTEAGYSLFSIMGSSSLALASSTQLGSGDIFSLNNSSGNVFLVDNSGNVGIGTSSPASKLDVWGDFRVGTSATPLLLADTSAGQLLIGTTSSNYDTYAGLVSYDKNISVEQGSTTSLVTSGFGFGTAVDVQGGYAYSVDGTNDFEVYDITDKTAPTLIGSTVTSDGTPTDVYVAGDYAYVAGFPSSIVDISDPANPEEIAVIDSSVAWGYHGEVQGNYWYIVRESQFAVIDVSDPFNPVKVGDMDPFGNAWITVVEGNYAYVAGSSNNAFSILDITDPTNPIEVSSLVTDDIGGIAKKGNIVYVADDINGITVIDVKDPGAPTVVTSVGGVLSKQIIVNGDYLYSGGDKIFDISSSTNPVMIKNGPATVSGGVGGHMDIQGGYLYTENGIYRLPTVKAPAAEFGSLLAQTLEFDYGQINRLLNVSGGLNVGQDAMVGGALTIQGTASSSLLSNNTNPALTVLSGNTLLGTTTGNARLTVRATGTNDILNLFETGGSEVFTVLESGNVGIGSSSPDSLLSIRETGISGAQVAGIHEYLDIQNTVENDVIYGDNAYIRNVSSATTTLVGNIIRIQDSSLLGNTVRGLEVQVDKGTTTLGENTALSGFARTFGVRGVTRGDAGGTFEPAGGFFQTEGTTQGNAIRGYSNDITTADLLSLFQDTSDFEGTGMKMNFGNSGGTFSSSTSRFIDLQTAGTSKFFIGYDGGFTAYGTSTIGEEGQTTTMAGLQIGYGGLCVDDDGECTASTTGKITAVSYGTSDSDLAEMYFSSDTLEPGEIVSAEGGLSVIRAATTTARVLGVVSTNPGITMGSDDTSLVAGERGYPIALSGRVPIKLSTENGPISEGDPIMLSSLPGVGMKATESATIVGYALEDYDGTRAYSEGYVNQFGDKVVKPIVKETETIIDERIHDGCYYGGGAEEGAEPCVPKDTSDIMLAEEEAKLEELQKAEAVAAVQEEELEKLSNVPAETVALSDDETVSVGQALLFVNLTQYRIDEEEQFFAELFATSTQSDGEVVSVWDKLKELTSSFVDGVLTLAGLKADKVETDELCVGETCVDEATLKRLLEADQTAAAAGSGTAGGQTDGSTTDSTSGSGSTDTTSDTSSTGETTSSGGSTDSSTTDAGSSTDETASSTDTTSGTDTSSSTDTTTDIIDTTDTNDTSSSTDITVGTEADADESLTETTTDTDTTTDTTDTTDTNSEEIGTETTDPAPSESTDTTDTTTNETPTDTTDTSSTETDASDPTENQTDTAAADSDTTTSTE